MNRRQLHRRILAAKTQLKAWRLNVWQGSTRRYLLYPCAWPLLRESQRKTTDRSANSLFLTPQINQLAGIGHQAAKWLAAYTLAKRYGLTFVHSSFSGGWDEFLGFGKTEIREQDLPTNTKKWTLPYFSGDDLFDRSHPIQKIISSLSSSCPHLLRLELDQGLADFSDSIETISTRFFSNHPELNSQPTMNRKIKVALHVRRGDIIGLKDTRNETKYIRFLPESYYISIMDQLASELIGMPYEFHIFTDGNAGEFEQLRHYPSTIWHDNDTAQDTFAQLVAADVLVMGRSGFSFMAAVINRGVKIVAVPWWHRFPDFGNWVKVDIRNAVSPFSDSLLNNCFHFASN